MLRTTEDVVHEQTERGEIPVTEIESTLRALIRLIPPARALKEDLEKGLHMELYEGAGEMAVQSYQGLQTSVARLTDDPYVESLSVRIPPNADDKQQVAVTLLAAGQLLAYLEGQTGLPGVGGGGNNMQMAPNINVLSGNIKGVTPEAIEKALDIAHSGATKSEEGEKQKA